MRKRATLLEGAFLAAALAALSIAAANPEGGPGSIEEIRRSADGLIATGSRAPDFALPDQAGETIRLAELRGAPLVLYFYPMDDTPGCTKEACAFRDEKAAYDSLRVRVVGVSTDDPRSHRAFADKHGLTFPLLADSSGEVSRLYGCAVEVDRAGGKRWIARRVTYLIDAEGTVLRVWPRVDPAGHAGEILAALSDSILISR